MLTILAVLFVIFIFMLTAVFWPIILTVVSLTALDITFIRCIFRKG
jgi:hypothetical protein